MFHKQHTGGPVNIPIDVTQIDWAKVAEGGKLLLWAGGQIKVWIEKRMAATPKSPSAPSGTTTEVAPKEIAIVVLISRPAEQDVRAFLQSQNIEADLFRIESLTPQLPPDPNVWEEIVREFFAVFNRIQATSGARKFHIFLAGPAALAFAMGCTLSTLFDVHLYQWPVGGTGSYYEVIRGTSRERLMSPPKSAAADK
jgi:hypothetical protein